MIGEHIQSADWKKEKHVPVIEAPEAVEAGGVLRCQSDVGQGSGPSQHH